MKNLEREKIFVTGATLFMLGFGLFSATSISDFLGGCFTGSAAIITYAYWKN